jgi:hypothetical protein
LRSPRRVAKNALSWAAASSPSTSAVTGISKPRRGSLNRL